MEPARPILDSLTPSQRRAVVARGNVLVMAGAGTGKTKTLVERCLDCVEREGAALDELLIVTFTEAAAAELRQRLRLELEKKSSNEPDNEHWARQLALFDLAHIGTLHGFCLKLIREHFYELGLDPQFALLNEGEARQRAAETLDAQFQSHYEGEDAFSLAVQELIQVHGGGRDEKIRPLVLRLHHYSQTRPDAAGWIAGQIAAFSAAEPVGWPDWLLAALSDWRAEWLPVLKNLGAHDGNIKAAELTSLLEQLPAAFSRAAAAEVLEQVVAADGNWPPKQKTVLRQPLEHFFAEARFLASLVPVRNGRDPLAEDWSWVHRHMETLLRLAQEFAALFTSQKRADGVLDFHDLEQFALKLLWDFNTDQPAAAAKSWRKKLRFIFVDEYQDINAAQDKIIAALAREGGAANRFLVGDVKQSIYRFRLADPKIFRDYAAGWSGAAGETIPLAENFRSREGLLHFVNSLCHEVMREEIGGVAYDAAAELRFGAAQSRAGLSAASDAVPPVELLIRLKVDRNAARENDDDGPADLDEAQKEARLVARQLKQLIANKTEVWDEKLGCFRPAGWRDIAILLRSPRGKAEAFAKEFERAGIPLAVARGGFYDSAEIRDLLSLLQLLDNPLQDVPCIAALRSPLVGLALDELAEIRRALKTGHFWTALNHFHHQNARAAGPLAGKISKFLGCFSRWRRLARQASLSECLEAVLADTLYADWLRTRPRAAERATNLTGFLSLARQFDQFQRQGLFRFLKFIEAQQAAEAEPEVSRQPAADAVRLMSIHQSKGLEFPVVVLADLAKSFNERDLGGEIIFDEVYGLCPKIKPPISGRRYPSLPHWLARRRQKRELRGEELRLLYVAMTRARDRLILTATLSQKDWDERWNQARPVTVQEIGAAKSFAGWLALWFRNQPAAAVGLKLLRWHLAEDENPLATTETIEPPPAAETAGTGQALAHDLQAMLAWNYPFQAATARPAKSSVTALRRAAEELDEEAEVLFPVEPAPPTKRPVAASRRQLSAAETGAAHHKLLQHVRLEETSNLAAEAGRLVSENYLSAAERAVLDLGAVAEFWGSKLGQNILTQGANVRRELPFTALFSPAELAAITGDEAEPGLAGEAIVVQGVADLVVLQPNEIWVVDFKTDDFDEPALRGKVKNYAPQLKLYAAALEKTFARKVTLRALYFLSLRRVVEI